jgi:hypothetical protein
MGQRIVQPAFFAVAPGCYRTGARGLRRPGNDMTTDHDYGSSCAWRDRWSAASRRRKTRPNAAAHLVSGARGRRRPAVSAELCTVVPTRANDRVSTGSSHSRKRPPRGRARGRIGSSGVRSNDGLATVVAAVPMHSPPRIAPLASIRPRSAGWNRRRRRRRSAACGPDPGSTRRTAVDDTASVPSQEVNERCPPRRLCTR